MLIGRALPFLFILSSGTFFAIVFGGVINFILACLVFLSILDDVLKGEAKFSSVKLIIVFFMSILLLVGVVVGVSIESGAEEYIIDLFFFTVKFFLIFLLLSNRLKACRIICGVFDILYWLMVLSLVTMAIKYFGRGSVFPVWQVGGVSTSFIATFYGVDFTDIKFFRNSSIFYEPGLFGVYLNILLVWLLARREEGGGRRRIALTLLATLTTLAPISIFVALLILLVHFNRKISELRLILTSVLLFLGSFALLSGFQGKLTSTSYVLRLQDFKIGFDLSKDFFWVGAGLYNENLVKDYYLSWVGFERSLSNGFFSLIYQTGLVFSCLYIYFLSRGFSMFSDWPVWLCAFFVVFILCVQPVQFSNAFLLFLFIGVWVNGKNDFDCSDSLRVLSPYR